MPFEDVRRHEASTDPDAAERGRVGLPDRRPDGDERAYGGASERRGTDRRPARARRRREAANGPAEQAGRVRGVPPSVARGRAGDPLDRRAGAPTAARIRGRQERGLRVRSQASPGEAAGGRDPVPACARRVRPARLRTGPRAIPGRIARGDSVLRVPAAVLAAHPRAARSRREGRDDLS